MQPIQYRGFTVQDSDRYYDNGLMYYPTASGIDHDADWDGDGYVYCGNCKYVDDVEEAKGMIDEYYATTTHYRVVNPNAGTITKFNFICEAITFCTKFGIDLTFLQLFVDGEQVEFDAI